MEHDRIIQLLNAFKSQHKSGRRALIIAVVGLVATLQAFLVFGNNANATDRAQVAAALVAIDAILFASWQWWEQRRQTTLEAYFTRLDLPNQRRLTYYEQLAALSSSLTTLNLSLDKEELARVLEQFYVFYVYAELDNFEYAMRKYSNQSIDEDLAERAAKTFISRCEQSQDFQQTVCAAVKQSGYPGSFQTLVSQLADCAAIGADAQQPHPMRFNELEIIRRLKAKP